ncbi:hypothetical protein CUJ89_13320 [Burkholderia pyrrocinia]|uniref:Uncharacterized protein n=1 Tax=Burkholderia pyrrocinia TaxID=60550 RepID=A0A2Z5MVR7_BURPY|nr:hypothetical protein CUJ89_13320 [Burkholderia pyrrocinia]
MRIESTSAGPREVWLTWDEDRSMGRVTARCFAFDDAMDRIVWAMDRAGDRAIADLAIGAGLPIFLSRRGPYEAADTRGCRPALFLYWRVSIGGHIHADSAADRRAPGP